MRNSPPVEMTAAERRQLTAVVLAGLTEDLNGQPDWTSQALIPAAATATVRAVVRAPGFVSGMAALESVYSQLHSQVTVKTFVDDGQQVPAKTIAAEITGPAAALLTGERTALNVIMHLSGIATLTSKFVAAIAGVKENRAVILDTRKTLPGWRHLEKFAVRCGGGCNHRLGLYDGVLIKDNHLAFWTETATRSYAEAAAVARQRSPQEMKIEIEVESFAGYQEAIGGNPDIILLDNMSTDEMTRVVADRDQWKLKILLEASGGVTLDTVAAIAKTGVDRISVGALTHSAPALDWSFDWGFSPRLVPGDVAG